MSEKAKQAIVSRIFGAYYSILPEPERSEELRAVLRGRLRLEQQDDPKERNPLAVGDRVVYRMESGTHEAIIEERLPRDSFLARSSPYETHVLAANVDRAVAVCSFKDPAFRPGFIDRFLSACETGHVAPHLAFTKTDLLAPETHAFASSLECLELLRDLVDPKAELDPPLEDRNLSGEDYAVLVALNYRRLGYKCYFLDLLSDETDEELDRLRAAVQEGTTLLTGHSGTGKSTLFNRLFGNTAQRTSDVSGSTGKGRHTTTNPILMVLPDRPGMVIDTPGIKEWGLAHLDRKTLLESYAELQEAAQNCKFRNCKHSEGTRECAVQAILQGHAPEILFPERQKSLDLMLESLKAPDRVRKGDYIKPTGRLRNKG